MAIRALVTLPCSDPTTQCASAWAEKTINSIDKGKIDFIKLSRERADGSVFESVIKKRTPSFVFINGHGGPDHICGHEDKILIGEGKNEKILSGTITYAISCSSAKSLASAAVKAGATAYIGYEEDFVFFISPEKRTHPTEDKTAEMFLLPANHVVVSLAKGHKVKEAVDSARGYFLKNAQKMISSEATSDEREYLRFLLWDMKALVAAGDQEASLC